MSIILTRKFIFHNIFFLFPVLFTMVFSFYSVSSQTAEQRGLERPVLVAVLACRGAAEQGCGRTSFRWILQCCPRGSRKQNAAWRWNRPRYDTSSNNGWCIRWNCLPVQILLLRGPSRILENILSAIMYVWIVASLLPRIAKQFSTPKNPRWRPLLLPWLDDVCGLHPVWCALGRIGNTCTRQMLWEHFKYRRGMADGSRQRWWDL